MDYNSRIYVAGHNGMVGSAILRKLKDSGYNNIITKTSKELDLTIQSDVENFFKNENIEYVFMCAAKVGGIYANNEYPAEFIYNNLMIQNNTIHYSYKYGVKKFMFLGSSCIYPKNINVAIKETDLLSNYLEKTNEPYAIAKIAGIKMCESYKRQYGFNTVCVMPTNLYGSNDNYHLQNSHVLPALIRKFHEAIDNNTDVVVQGDGTPRREFLYVDDLAESCIEIMKHHDIDIINIGTSEDLTIKELAEIISSISNFKNNIVFDNSMPNGTMRKLLDVSLMKSLGLKNKTSLIEGIKKIYYEYK